MTEINWIILSERQGLVGKVDFTTSMWQRITIQVWRQLIDVKEAVELKVFNEVQDSRQKTL